MSHPIGTEAPTMGKIAGDMRKSGNPYFSSSASASMVTGRSVHSTAPSVRGSHESKSLRAVVPGTGDGRVSTAAAQNDVSDVISLNSESSSESQKDPLATDSKMGKKKKKARSVKRLPTPGPPMASSAKTKINVEWKSHPSANGPPQRGKSSLDRPKSAQTNRK